MNQVCSSCARRTWLLEKLSVRLDFRARDLSRFWNLLELSDLDLIDAIGGRRRAELRVAHAAWSPAHQDHESVKGVCKHRRAYPRHLLGDRLAPHALYMRGGVDRLTNMLDTDLVAIVGTKRASDYGMETARELARGLAASGVIVASDLDEGIPTAVHRGILEADGTTLAVAAGSLERCSPACCAPLHRRLSESGVMFSESHRGKGPRAWRKLANARTLALIAKLVIVVEAGERPWELACAQIASSRGRHLAAVPGRVSSAASKGTNSLLMGGATLVRNPQDALDALFGTGVRTSVEPASDRAELEPHLALVLERVGSGEDTIEKLVARGAEPMRIATELTELELRGRLVRGEGGRYLLGARLAAE